MKVMIGPRVLSSSSFSMTGGGGATTTCSTLWTPRAFFAALHLEDEAVVLANLRRDLRLDRLVDVRENVKRHQLGDELVRLQAELDRQLLHDDRRLDVDDLLRLGFGFGGGASQAALRRRSFCCRRGRSRWRRCGRRQPSARLVPGLKSNR